MLNAILYLVKTGCKWRMLPIEFPPWKSVYTYYRRLCLRGTWEAPLDELNQISRQRSGRSASPTQAMVDSQSVKTVYRGIEREYDCGKKIKGRTRHIGVDSNGRLLHVQAHRANQHDGSAGIEMFDALKEKYPTLELPCADWAYGGMACDYTEILLETTVQIVRKIGDGF